MIPCDSLRMLAFRLTVHKVPPMPYQGTPNDCSLVGTKIEVHSCMPTPSVQRASVVGVIAIYFRPPCGSQYSMDLWVSSTDTVHPATNTSAIKVKLSFITYPPIQPVRPSRVQSILPVVPVPSATWNEIPACTLVGLPSLPGTLPRRTRNRKRQFQPPD